MAKCGITIYDDLPGRVGWIDVDALRYALNRAQREQNYFTRKLNEAVFKHSRKENKK